MSARVALVLLAVLVSGAARAQAPVVQAFRGGGTGGDIGQKVAVGGNGQIAVTGDFEGVATFGTVTLTSADNPAARSDVFVVVYNENGVAQWGRRMGTGVFNDFAGDVAFDGLGNVYVSGYFTGVATFDGGANPTVSLTTRSDFDVFLAKYSASGDLLWVRQSGGTEQDTGRGLHVEWDGAVYQAGGFTGTATWGEAATGDTTITSEGSSDAFLAHYSATGVLQWVRTVGGSQSDTGYDVDGIPFSTGPVVLLGQFSGVTRVSPTLALSSRGLSDVFVARYDADGTALWAQQIGGAGNDYGRGVSASAFGDYVYAAGSFEDDVLIGNDILQSAGFSDIYVAQISLATGALIGGRRGGGTGFDFADDVAAQPPVFIPTFGPPGLYPVYVVGYVDTAGTFPDPGGTTTVTAAGGVDGVLVGYDADAAWSTAGGGGRVLGAFPLGGTNSDRTGGVAIEPFQHDLIVTGPFRSSMTLGTTTLTSAGGNDVYVARVEVCPTFFCQPTANEPGAENAPVLGGVVPNPVTGVGTVTLTLAEGSTVRVEVLDALGRRVLLVHDGPLAAGRHELPLDAGALAPGAYVVRATGDGLGAVRRMAVAR